MTSIAFPGLHSLTHPGSGFAVLSTAHKPNGLACPISAGPLSTPSGRTSALSCEGSRLSCCESSSCAIRIPKSVSGITRILHSSRPWHVLLIEQLSH